MPISPLEHSGPGFSIPRGRPQQIPTDFPAYLAGLVALTNLPEVDQVPGGGGLTFAWEFASI